MKISLNWLKQYVEIPEDLDPREIALKLTVSTVEVEEIISQQERYDKLVVGEIIDIINHPQADKLKICQVKAGKDQILQVICGAANIYKGMKSILALPGAKVKWHGQGGLTVLEKTKIRGVESLGMLCAPSEIGLSEEFKEEDGVIDLHGEGKTGQAVAEILHLNDVIFEIDNKSITNRPDLWGHLGLAREVAALFDLKFKEPFLAELEDGKGVDLKIKIEDKENCSRYLSAAVGDIKIEPSPMWLQRLLTSVGMRPINNLVDITNFVMLELGRPSHAFDRRKIAQDTIIVRRARSGEKLKTLDGLERELTEEMCLVCDAEVPQDLGGIMGGENSEIDNTTTEVILELANFNPVNIRKTASRLGLRTEASIRFEKGLSPVLTDKGLQRLLALIKELLPQAKVISKVVDVNFEKTEKREIKLAWNFLFNRLGLELPKKEVIKILTSLSFGVEDDGDSLIVVPPVFRVIKDMSLPEDVVEEVARIYGYDKIPPRMPQVFMEPPPVNEELLAERRVKDILCQIGGATEVLNYSFTSAGWIKLLGLKTDDHLELLNSVSVEQKYLRQNLFENMLANLQDNNRFFKEINIFECGRVYANQSGNYSIDNRRETFLPKQEKYLAGLCAFDDQSEPFFTVKGLVETLFNHLEVEYAAVKAKCTKQFLDKENYVEIKNGNQIIGWIGRISQELLEKLSVSGPVGAWEINFGLLTKYIQDTKKYQPLPKFPGMIYDLSLVLPKTVAWADIQKEVLEASALVKRVELFDLYEIKTLGPDKRSLAFHVYLQSEEKTLEAKEALIIREKIVKLLIKKFKAEIRQ